jgi:anti-sigma regulatory factor (Ser/Thr protein kinase)
MGEPEPMTPLASLDREAVMESWDEIQAFVAERGEQLLGSGPALYNLRLATEELLSNVIRYAPSDRDDTQAPLRLWLTFLHGEFQGKPALILQLEDNGPAFDPQLERERQIDTTQPIQERPIGGLGLFLVQQSVDHVDYAWCNQRNRYRLFMWLPEPSPA